MGVIDGESVDGDDLSIICVEENGVLIITDQRLIPTNEVSVRALIAEELNIEIAGKFSELLGDKIQDINVKAS